LILPTNLFPRWFYHNVDRRIEVLGQQAEGTARMLERVGQEAAASLKELEAHYYLSALRSPTYD
jgi:mediator of RNA polymerase II transcription subunit 22